jgi:putative hydrolase of the HAD superfamily
VSLAGVSAVEAVLLDAGGVLMLPDPSAFRARLRPFGVEPDDASCYRAAYLGVAEVDRLRRADYDAANRFIAGALGVPDRHLEAAAEAIELVYTRDGGVAIDGVAAQLVRLCEAGIRLGIVSNASGEVEAELLSHRICSRDGKDCAEVEFVIDSQVVGVEKPDPAIFALALGALRLPAERCVYLGDSVYFDIGGARAAGIEAMHLNPFTECAAADHADVPTLRDFVDQLLMTTQV